MEEENKRLFGFSKALFIITKIIRICMYVGIGGLVVAATVIPLVFKSIEVKDNNFSLNLHDQKIEIIKEDSSYSIEVFGNKVASITDANEVTDLNKLFELGNVKKMASIAEIGILIGIASLVLFTIVLKNLEYVFKEIYSTGEVFKIEFFERFRNAARLLLSILILGIVSDAILNIISANNVISFRFANVYEILFLYLIAYVFEYGANKIAKKEK